MNNLLRDFAGDEPNIRYWKFSNGEPLVGKFEDAKMESNKFSPKLKPNYYISANGFVYKFTSESKGLARQLADLFGKKVSIQRIGYGIETKFVVKEVTE